MKYCINIFFCFIFLATAMSQSDKVPAVKKTTKDKGNSLMWSKAGDSLFVEVQNGHKFLMHRLKAGQTLYSIKNFYSVDITDLYFNNLNLETNDLKIGQVIRIPIVSEAIKLYQKSSSKDSSLIPLYYKIRPAETLYRISRVFFRLPVDIVKSRNHLISDNLEKGQVLQIGWISKTGIPDSLYSFNGLTGILGEESKKNKYKYEERFTGMNEEVINGIASWDKSMDLSSKNKLYVMSSTVKKGRIVRLENPMTQRYLYAKVVASKPQNSSAEESIVILTPTVARALGGLDSRFHVRMYYCK
jgi:LysM repeat protein